MSTADIYNFRRVSDDIVTGGHPTADQLRDAADEGFGAVVNLAPVDHRSVPDEDVLVRSMGMAYHHIAVIWDAPTAADFEAFEQTMAALDGERMLIHCAAQLPGHRVLLAVRAQAPRLVGRTGGRVPRFDLGRQ